MLWIFAFSVVIPEKAPGPFLDARVYIWADEVKRRVEALDSVSQVSGRRNSSGFQQIDNDLLSVND